MWGRGWMVHRLEAAERRGGRRRGRHRIERRRARRSAPCIEESRCRGVPYIGIERQSRQASLYLELYERGSEPPAFSMLLLPSSSHERKRSCTLLPCSRSCAWMRSWMELSR